MVAAAVPGCWEVVAPEEITVIRAVAAASALHDLCPAAALGELVAALPLLRRAAAACTTGGRILAAANRDLWPRLSPEVETRSPTELAFGVAEAWQACTTLREHRGDGHVAGLVAHGLSGLEAHLLVSGTSGVAVEVLRDNRGWSEAQWEDGVAGLVARGLLQADGTATVAGAALHRRVEDLTDQLAEPAYADLRPAEVTALHDALHHCAAPIQAASLLPFPNPMGLPRL
jgi:hypothetical protein